MIAQTQERKRKRVAPYVPASALSEFFDHIRTVREPEVVDNGLLQDYGLSKPNALALLSTLKFLGITDDKGRPTPVFRQLQTGGDEFRETLKSVVERSYADLLSRLDVSRDTKDKIVNYFARNYSPATAERAARLFLDLCGEASIPTASQPRKADRSRSQPTKSRLPRQDSPQVQEQENTPAGTDLFSSFFNPFGESKRKQERHQVYRVPLPDSEWVAIQLPVPMSEGAWAQMMAMLSAMKPGLVVSKNDGNHPKESEVAG